MSPDATLKQALFKAARHLSTADDRRAYLDRACADDPELRRKLETLLELEAPANKYFHDLNSAQPGNRGASQNGRPHQKGGPGQNRVVE